MSLIPQMVRARFLSLGLLVACGCLGGNGSANSLPATVPAFGIVKLNGEPLASAVVTFIPRGDTPGNGSSGTTDTSGRYELLQYRGGHGAAPGEYTVTVSRYVGPGGKPVVLDASSPPPADLGAVESLPDRFSSALATKLTATVPAEGGQFDFDLKSK